MSESKSKSFNNSTFPSPSPSVNVNGCFKDINENQNHLESQTQTQQQQTKRLMQMRQIQNEGLKLFKNKNQDYGDAFATYGPVGVLVRMGDKISRLQSITKNGITLVDNESLRDTLLDLHNYSAMAIMLLDDDLEVKSV